MTLERDIVLKGRYRIIEILGQGGMGAVYRALDENLGVYVAIKENLFSTDEYNRQFRREAIILASMKHANLPKVSDHFEIEGQGQYFAMEYIEGEDLRQRMDRIGILPDEEVIVMGAAICDALQYLHTRTPIVLHRDIKPGNIKINPEGGVFLVDFGLAKIVQGSEATTTGARAMTPGYSSPEQYGTARTDARSDVYSLGATLYASITGIIPEDGLARAMDQADLTAVRKRNPKSSRRLSSVIEKALSIHPDDRYQSANELKLALLKASSATRQNITATETTISPPPQAVMDAIANGEMVHNTGAVRSEISGESSGRRRRRQLNQVSRLMGIAAALLIIFGAMGYIFMSVLGGGDLLAALRTTPISDANFTVTPAGNESGGDDLDGTLLPTFTPAPSQTPTLEVINSPTPFVFGTMTATPTTVPIIVGEDTEFDYEFAFVSDRSGSYQIWLQTLGGGVARQLTNIEGGACQPAWKPDGKELIFIAPCSEKKDIYLDSQLYLMDIEKGEVHLLLNNIGVFDPAWSPNGKYLLFTYAQDVGSSQIYRFSFELGLVDIMAGGDDDQLYYDAAWAPTGRQLVFTSSRLGGLRLFVMSNVPGGDATPLTRSGPFTNSEAYWTLDGAFIYFAQKPENSGRAPLVIVVSVDMLDITDPIDYVEAQVSLGMIVPEADPVVSVDGSLILFTSWPDGENKDIFVMFADGSASFRLTTDPALDYYPVFRPAEDE